MTPRATISDVAAAAKVSVTTVSHVLNSTEGARVAEETRRRVRDAAERLGYVPSRLARGLRLNRTHTLALLSDHIATSPHAGRIIVGAQEAALERGWTLLVLDTGGDAALERRSVGALARHQVDGLLYGAMYHRRVEVPAVPDGLPVVLLDARSDDPRVPAVVPDEVGGGRAAVEELTAAGHHRIGFLTNRDDIPATRGRLEGYRRALRAAGLRYDPGLIVAEESVTGGGYVAARRLLTSARPPTALFCFNDRMAMGAYRAAAELGLRIPQDLSVVGFDNQELIAEGLHPALTTVALPHYEMGAWAVDTVLDMVEDPRRRGSAEPVLMPCPLVRRESVAPVSA